ncbi:carbon starvation protein CstA [Candidatus Epulonipiscium fishelsonii]|uniref:Carbon starvation protein CstA n=1 Tax=Candidatus Epulonipiscium fishelsonii TaxID=77094 RepID=A0ACC8XA01_9FIRM|nr:carbon starvation protein CstA [Epulopiscium sp. SCG-B05WGA-EpuloA1]ONI39058.1 carbon starvation protein CstA [Epulopiscium sp. SCG-B11WGA-EpuloA1]
MITFILSLVALFLGFFVYGKIIEKIFKIDENREVPAVKKADGLDYVLMPTWKAFLIQFLNIAGTGPIFGAIAGAMWGPNAFLWIVFGCIFGGAVHDFLIGMMSLRSDGASVSVLVGSNLGEGMRKLIIGFSAILLLLVGVVFVSSPADLLVDLTGQNRWIFVAIIMIYYIIATVLPIDKVIGKIYPIFGIALFIMAIGIVGGMITTGLIKEIPEFSFTNPHVQGKSIFPYLFISIACGAISGFHATQSPMMARCIKNEREGHRVFYGAMISEGIIALIWATASMTFFGGLEGLSEAGAAAVVVNKISEGLMGSVGMVLAVLGVIACPITSGDTAFRSLRLTIADTFNIDQSKPVNRYKIIIPIFVIAIALLFIDFNIIWRYFSWSNQTLACIALWAAAAFLKKQNSNYFVAIIPAMFMTVVVTCYILVAPEGFGAIMTSVLGNIKTAELVGIVVGIAVAASAYIMFNKKIIKE